MASHKENLHRVETPGVLSRPQKGISRIPVHVSRKKTRTVLKDAKLNTNSSCVQNSSTKVNSKANEYTDIPLIMDEFVPDPNALKEIFNEKPIPKKDFDVRESIRALPMIDDKIPVGIRASMYRRNTRNMDSNTMTTPACSSKSDRLKLLCEKMMNSSSKMGYNMLNEATPIHRLDYGMVKSPSCPSLNSVQPTLPSLPSTPSLPDLCTDTTLTGQVTDMCSDIVPPIMDEFVPDPNALKEIFNEKPIPKKDFDVRESIRALPMIDDDIPVGIRASMYRRNTRNMDSNMTTPAYSSKRNRHKLLCEKMMNSSSKLGQNMLNEATPIHRLDYGMVKSPSCPSLNSVQPTLPSLPSTPSLPDLCMDITSTGQRRLYECTPIHSSSTRNNHATPISTLSNMAFSSSSFNDVEDELVFIAKTAPKPSGLARDYCPNPVARTIEREYV